MTKNELFIVEGKSACSALRLASDKKSQCVYAIQGKLANISKMSHDAVEANHECKQLFNKLGGDFASAYQIDNLPYSRVLILMDPDIDGSHSSALVLSFFARYCEPIVQNGLLSIIKPPMFKACAQGGEPVYAWSEAELQQLLTASHAGQSMQTTRFKGIAQFSIDECHEFLSNPASRRESVLSLA